MACASHSGCEPISHFHSLCLYVTWLKANCPETTPPAPLPHSAEETHLRSSLPLSPSLFQEVRGSQQWVVADTLWFLHTGLGVVGGRPGGALLRQWGPAYHPAAGDSGRRGKITPAFSHWGSFTLTPPDKDISPSAAALLPRFF